MRRLLFALVLLAADASEATLLEIDLLAPGDALVTRDTVSGRDWLDIDETTGLSIADIAAGAGGWATAGWRHATASELCGLLAYDGAAPSPCPGSGYVGTSGEGQLILDLLGISIVREQDYLGGTLVLSQIWAVFDDATGDPALHGELELSVDRHTDGWTWTYVGLSPDSIPESYPYDQHLLVRAVPEPTPGLLLAFGLAGLALQARKPISEVAAMQALFRI